MEINLYNLFIAIIIYILLCYFNAKKNKKHIRNN